MGYLAFALVGVLILWLVLRQKKPTVYTCDICGAEFATQAELETHFNEVHGGYIPPPPPLGQYRLIVHTYDAATGPAPYDDLPDVLVTVDSLSNLTDIRGRAYFDLEKRVYYVSAIKAGYVSIENIPVDMRYGDAKQNYGMERLW